MDSIEKAAARLARESAAAQAGEMNKASGETAQERVEPSAEPPREPAIVRAQQAADKAPQPPPAKSPTATDTHSVQVDRLFAEGRVNRLEGVLAEQYRLIKRRIRANVERKRTTTGSGNLVMVTSALPGEGKTFTSLNLALSMAMEMDTTVLLVDVDLVKGTLSTQLGLSGCPGFTDVLNGRVIMAEAMRRTDEPKLSVLPVGTPQGKATELLGSARMKQLAEELAKRYADRIVLFDAPPLLSTSQAAVLSGLVDQVVIVVAQSLTPERAVEDAVSLLAPGVEAGFVLNMTSTAADAYYGQY